MKKWFIIFLVICGCGSSETGVLDPRKVQEDINDAQVELIIVPESLQIREICTTPHDCVFRQRCGRMQLRLINHLSGDIKVLRISRELISKEGIVERSSSSDAPESGYIIPAGSEHASTGPTCSCGSEDEFCTTDYPHPASPFLWERSERVTVFYEGSGGIEKSVEATEEYKFIRDKYE